jgi:hypothetical protein
METLRKSGVPLAESAQRYVFLLDEYFVAHPEADASDPAESLARMLYEYDPSTRIAIDRWHGKTEEPVAAPSTGPRPRQKITGAEWITMVHEDKMDYVSEAMQVLEKQRVPMEKTLYGYTDALDKLFTEKPELPASDSVVALASYLYDSEPKAREVLEALRLQ